MSEGGEGVWQPSTFLQRLWQSVQQVGILGERVVHSERRSVIPGQRSSYNLHSEVKDQATVNIRRSSHFGTRSRDELREGHTE